MQTEVGEAERVAVLGPGINGRCGDGGVRRACAREPCGKSVRERGGGGSGEGRIVTVGCGSGRIAGGVEVLEIGGDERDGTRASPK